MHCRRCGSEDAIKNGQHLGVQRWKCKGCGYQYTRVTARGRSTQEKVTALWLYVHGMSLNAIGKLLKVSTPSVLRWRGMAQGVYEKPVPGSAVVVELDERWHFLCSKKQTLALESLLSHYRSIVGLGNVAVVIGER